jgi:chemotaxis protein CheD
MPGSPSIAALFAQRVTVGVGDLAASNDGHVTLSTYALGSCVGIVAYDAAARAGGILHFMLPESTLSPERAAAQPAMFADTGLPQLLRKLAGLRAETSRLRLFLAGGAAVLQGNDPFKIGARNIDAAKELVQRYGLFVRACDLGGTVNRTLHLEIDSGQLTLKLPSAVATVDLGA